MKKVLITFLILSFTASAYESSANNLQNLVAENNLSLKGIPEWVKNIWNDVLSWLEGLKKIIVFAWKEGGKELAEKLCKENLDSTPEDNALICNIIVKILGLAVDKMDS